MGCARATDTSPHSSSVNLKRDPVALKQMVVQRMALLMRKGKSGLCLMSTGWEMDSGGGGEHSAVYIQTKRRGFTENTQ